MPLTLVLAIAIGGRVDGGNDPIRPLMQRMQHHELLPLTLVLTIVIRGRGDDGNYRMRPLTW